jgi:hypothetical protein
MATLRSIRWVLAMVPALSLSAGCGGSNESGLDFKGTTTSPDATASAEEKAKRGAEASTKNAIPKGYPRSGAR